MARPRGLQLGRLKTVDRWDLGLMLALLFVSCLAVGVIYKRQSSNALLLARGELRPVATKSAPAPSLAAQALQSPKPPPVLSAPDLKSGALQQDAAAATSTVNSVTLETRPLPVFKPKAEAAREPEVTWYRGEKYVYWKSIRMRVTAYAPDKRCCWPFEGTTTASGASVKTNRGRLVAADTRLIPFGCLVSVPDYHNATPVPVLDRGGAIKGRRLDVLMPTYSSAQEWGTREVLVKVYRPADSE